MAEPAQDPLRAIGEALDNPAPAPTLGEPGERIHDDDDAGDEPFPRDCPVKPLGLSSGLDGSQRCYYLNVNGEIVGLEAGNKHGKNNLIALFGHKSAFLEHEWPQWSKPVREYNQSTKQWVEISPAKLIGFDQARASKTLIMECSRRGIFEPTGRMRGRGAHALPGGGLAMHFGDAVATLRPRAKGALHPLEWWETGLYDRFVYPAAMPIPRPWAQGCSPKAAISLSTLLRTWNWKRPALDPILLLGAIGQGFIGGALGWRSNVWITGGRGTGKSTLNGREAEGQGIIPQLYGEGLFRTGNTSAAAIRQMLKNSTVPVMIDEAEPGADNRKITEVIELARISSSGDKIHRGGQDHQAHEFTLQSPFWFSSINIPPIEASDRSRLAILELKPFAQGMLPPDFSKFDFAEIGRQLHRRMIDAWPLLAQAKRVFHLALSAKGHDNRACDQFGNLLACAHLLLNDELPDDEEVRAWVDLCLPERMAEVSDAVSDEDACLTRLLTSPVQPRGRDSREAVSTLIGRAVAKIRAPGDLTDSDHDAAAKALEQIGLKLVNPDPKGGGKMGWVRMLACAPGYLAIANNHRELDSIFAGSKFQGGVHKQTLGRIDGALLAAGIKIAHATTRATLVPLHMVLDESDLPDASKPEGAAAWWAGQAGEGA